jgi:hypothetical protein
MIYLFAKFPQVRPWSMLGSDWKQSGTVCAV